VGLTLLVGGCRLPELQDERTMNPVPPPYETSSSHKRNASTAAASRSQASAVKAAQSQRQATGACDRTARPRLPDRVVVAVPAAPIFIYAEVRPVPLATLEKGTALPVVAAEGEWFRIRFGRDRVGYVHCANVLAAALRDDSESSRVPVADKPQSSSNKTTPAPPASTGKVIVKAVVLEQPRGDSQVLTMVTPGTVLELLGQDGDWYSVVVPGGEGTNNSRTTGWLHRGTIQLVQTRGRSR
jgi:hypothetical protein